MRAVVTRVAEAGVIVAGELLAEIGPGLLVLLGVGEEDTVEDARALAKKVVHLRIFPDDHRPLNRSLLEAGLDAGLDAGLEGGGQVLVVSQFTLLADTSRGRRPSFVHAAAPEVAEPLCREFSSAVAEFGPEVRTGRFGATMEVASVNDGPVTILLSTRAEDAI